VGNLPVAKGGLPGRRVSLSIWTFVLVKQINLGFA
jgi:hypothetical protein